jgi:ribosomal protein S18 acetylase RimI-like enzyme
MVIRPYVPADADTVVDLGLRAWAPVFVSIEAALGQAIYRALYPDWRAGQRKAIEDVLVTQRVWVAEQGGAPVGFVSLVLHEKDRTGEIYMLAVDPEYQRRGIGAALTDYAVGQMREAGMDVAMINTGGDPGHAPARRAYERAGFHPFPVVQYYKKL